MPYIITTSIDVHGDELSVDVVSRTAVATLDEAQEAAHDRLQVEGGAPEIHDRATYERLIDQWEAIGESGGTIGPLPDGTVIEVRRMLRDDVTRTAGEDRYIAGMTAEDMVAAFNAA